MLFYCPPSKFKLNIKFCKLNENKEAHWLEPIAQWVESKWGYIRGFPGLKYRKESLEKIQHHFYVVTYADQPIGMFALFDADSINPKDKNIELMYVYVDESFRGLGVGKAIVEKAKELCTKQNATMIFDTLNPNLNQFYKKHGATEVCEGQLLDHPTSVLRI